MRNFVIVPTVVCAGVIASIVFKDSSTFSSFNLYFFEI